MRNLKVHCTYTNTAVVISGALASKICNIPHIWHIHESIGTGKDQFQHFLGLGFIFRLIDKLSIRIIANANKIKTIFPQSMWYKICVVYNGFNIKQVNTEISKNSESRIRTQSADDKLTIAVIGNLSERKGQRIAILAMPMILKNYPSTKLLIVGKDTSPNQAFLKTLESLVKQYSLDNHVKFVGYQENVDEIYARTDLLLVPSSVEPFGRVIVEAMLAGVPVLATAVGGIPEIIEHGKNGILLQSREPNVIADAVITLLGSEERRRTFAATARLMAEQRFNMNTMIKEIEDIICEVSNKKQDPKRLL
jgi:glycosyltransferase involved in cell wall biosynthesis